MTIERAKGNDPYDALRSRRVPRGLLRAAFARQLLIQVRKRSRVDLAMLLGIEPFYMAKTLGAFALAESRLLSADGSGEPRPFVHALLERHDVARVGAGSWGYEFDVQTRWAFYPAYTPNLISTVFCARGLCAAGLVCGEVQWVNEMHLTASYLLDSLLTDEGWFRYTPDSPRLIHNANLLGAAVVAASGRLLGDEERVAAGVSAAQVSIGAQDSEGGWPYGAGSGLAWRDNFHTAYNLDALLLIWLASDDATIHSVLMKGAAYWADVFFGPDGAPAYFADGSGAHEIHSAGTAIDVAARLAQRGLCDDGLARRVSEWTDRHLVAPDGSTYYAVTNGRVDRRHFVRWGDCHLAMGRSSLTLAKAGRTDPLELAIQEA